MSIYSKMAWRNIWRNPRRTVLTICAIAFACLLLVFMLSFQFGSYEAMINASVKINTGHLKIQVKEYQDKRGMHQVVPEPLAIGKILDTIQGIYAYTFRANGFSLVSSEDRTYGILVTGIDPAREETVSTIKQLVRKGNYLSPADTGQGLVGSLLAQNLKASIGDELTLLGQGRDGSIAATVVIVKGIYSSGINEVDRNTIQIPLKDFQEIYSMRGGVHEVVIVADTLKHVASIKRTIKQELDRTDKTSELTVMDWMELVPGLLQSIQLDLVSGFIMYGILIVVVAFSILNTFLMAIFERTKEFGVMMAVGTTPGRLTRLVVTESMMLTMIGIVVGIVLGSLVTMYFQMYGIDFTGANEILNAYGISGRLYPRLSIISATVGPVAVLIITFLSALYPALKVRRLRPVEAMQGA